MSQTRTALEQVVMQVSLRERCVSEQAAAKVPIGEEVRREGRERGGRKRGEAAEMKGGSKGSNAPACGDNVALLCGRRGCQVPGATEWSRSQSPVQGEKQYKHL